MKKSDIKAKAENFIKLENEIRNDIKEFLLEKLAGTHYGNPMKVFIKIYSIFDIDHQFASEVTEMWIDDDNALKFTIDNDEVDFDCIYTLELADIVNEIK